MHKERAAAWVVEVLKERAAPDAPAVGLRERKKRELRQRISDTATMMFLDRGFDRVRVAEVAAACGVSEKTVFNYFPTKESLVLDRMDDAQEQLRRALTRVSGRSLVDAVVDELVDEVRRLARLWGEPGVEAGQAEMMHRFMAMLEATPSLRAAQADGMEAMTTLAAEVLADRTGVSPDDPEPQMAATALVGLWRIQQRSLLRHSADATDRGQATESVIAEIRRAGRLIDTGLWCFGALAAGGTQREQLRLAAVAMEDARRQVVTAVRQARGAWRAVAGGHHRR